MTMNLIHTNRNVDRAVRAKTDWAALTAISATDASSLYPAEGYVTVDAQAIVHIAALLDGKSLTNGQTVTTYDFSFDREGGDRYFEAHVNAFGPSLLPADRLEAVRTLLSATPIAVAMLDEIVARGLQVSLSTESYSGQIMPHIKCVNWPADEVEINRSGGNMVAMLRDLGLRVRMDGPSEVPFEDFARAVNDNAARTDYPGDRLRAFVACGRRQGATHVHWA